MQREERSAIRAAHAAVAFAIGIAVAGRAGGPAAPWGLGALGIALIAISGRRRAAWWLAIACAGIGLGRCAAEPPPPAPAGTAADDRVDDVFDGEIVGPIERGAGGDRVVIDPGAGAGRVGAWVPAGALAPGDRVRARGRLMRPRGFRDPGAVDRVQVARDRGIDLELDGAAVEHVGGGWSAWAWPVAAQRWGSAFVAARGGDPEANAVVRGAVLGDRSAIGPDTDAAWRAAGVYHVLSVSGLHLAVVALLAFAILRRLLVLAVPSRAAQATAAIAAGALGVAYTALTGAQVATERALIVVLVVLGGAATGRRARLPDALGVAAIAILAARPQALGDPSFQLSFAAAVTLAFLGGAGPPPPRGRIARALAWIVRGVIASTTVTAVTAPITAAHFHQIAAGGAIGNLIVTPLVELVAIPLALAGVAIGALWSGLGGVLVDAAIAACAAGCAIARAIAAVAPASAAPPLPAIASVAWLGAIAVLIAGARGAIRPARAATAALAMTAVVAIAAAIGHAPRGDLRVTFLDVGQGDAAVIEAPGGEVWLVDAGGAPGAGDPATTGPGDALVRFLAARGIDHVDVAIVSHPHPDHYLGLFALAGRVPVGELWSADEPDAPVPSPDAPAAAPGAARMPSFADAAAALAAHGTRLVHPPLGVAHLAGGAALVVLAPATDLGDGRGPRAVATADPVKSVNDDSLVVAVEFAGRRVVFTGDLEAEGEADLVARDPRAIAADVVKVPHHGSPTSSTDALVAATHPTTAVISCGVANRFGFPSPAVVARWRAAGATVLETDRRGAITVEVDRDGGLDVGAYDP